MKVLIAGGTGFLGSALARSLTSAGHHVLVLTRRPPRRTEEVHWDGRSLGDWAGRMAEVDAVANLTGFGLEHWPWTASRKKRFVDSRVVPAEALTTAIEKTAHRPRIFLQISGINRYGLRGEGVADESDRPADDFLAQLTVQWEAAAGRLDGLGLRVVVARSAVVLDASAGLFPLMALPVRLMVGGPLGNGRQAVPWIHIQDEIRAFSFLLENESASGAFNLIAPQPASNAEFMRSVARTLHRPYWLRTPAFLLRMALGEMSDLVLEGRYSHPRRLGELGFQFRFPTLDAALADLFGWSKMTS
jgi:hypothetical protein